MKTVYKYPLSWGTSHLKVPAMAKVVLFDQQNGNPHVWYEVNTECNDVTTELVIVPTGGSIPPYSNHRGSYQHGGLVWHLYERQI